MRKFKLSEDHEREARGSISRYEITAHGLYLGMGFAAIRAVQCGLADVSASELKEMAEDAGYVTGCIELYNKEGRRLYPPVH